MRVWLIRFLNKTIFYTKAYKILGTKNRVVLLYHRINRDYIVENYFVKGIFVKDKEFRKQMYYLSRSARRNKTIISFDDGYRDTYIHGVPILDMYDMQAIFFITTGFINRKMPMWVDVLNEYANENGLTREEFTNLSIYIKSLPLSDRARFLRTLGDVKLLHDSAMTWDELAVVAKSHIIGNHTARHPNFSREEATTIKEEILTAKVETERRLGVRDVYFAYPDGDLGKDESQTKTILLSLGYKYCFTTRRGSWGDNDDPCSIKRIPVYYWDDLATFVNKCHGINIEDALRKGIIRRLLGRSMRWAKRRLRF